MANIPISSGIYLFFFFVKTMAEGAKLTGAGMFGTVVDQSIESEITQSYIDYAMSVIVSRALPDTRDGFKPVLRRILYAMRNV